jgi:uncharacterized protein YqeY
MTCPIIEKLGKDLVTAMKAKDEATVTALRTLKSALKYKEVDLKRELTDAEAIDVLSHQAKQRRESIEGFEKGSRPESAAKEKVELALIQSFLPAAMPAEELAALVEEAVKSVGASSSKDMGKVMAYLNPKVKGRCDMSALSAAVKSKLG